MHTSAYASIRHESAYVSKMHHRATLYICIYIYIYIHAYVSIRQHTS